MQVVEILCCIAVYHVFPCLWILRKEDIIFQSCCRRIVGVPVNVRIGADEERIIAFIQLISLKAIAVRVIIIVGCQIVGVDLESRYVFAVGLQNRGLGKINKLNVSLFDFSSDVGQRYIQLNNILTGFFACID